MLKIIVVDDEKTIRNGLTKYVDWTGMGCELIGVFASGEEVIDYLKDHEVHIILTDIVMGGISGLDLIKKVSKIRPTIKTIILSGYDDFSFVKQAMDYGACFYLTKPVNFEELETCIEKIHHKFEEERNILKIKNQNSLFTTERFFYNLVSGEYLSEDKLSEEAAKADIKLNNGTYYIGIVLLNESKSFDKNLIVEKLRQSIEGMPEHYLFGGGVNEIIMLYHAESPEAFAEKVAEELNKCVGEQYYNISISAGCNNHLDFAELYKKTKKILEYRLIKKQNILYYNELSGYMNGVVLLEEDNEKEICKLLAQKDYDKLSSFIYSLIKNENVVGTKFLYNICIEVFLVINRYINENITQDPEFQQLTFNTIRNFLYKDSEEEIKEILNYYLKTAIKKVDSLEGAKEHILISKMKKYIDENYSDYITLETISKAIYAHPVYLSKLFRDKTGMNFIEYLTELRINKAKELLKNPDHNIYDISYMVGYESSKHFSKVFKDATGMTPKEYRNKMSNL